MSSEDVIAVATRLFCVYVLVQTMLVAPAQVQQILHLDEPGWLALYGLLAPFAFWVCVLAACACLWFFPLTVARRLLPVMKEPRSEQVIGSSVALGLGIALIGLWLLAEALIQISYWVVYFIRFEPSRDGTLFEWPAGTLASVISTAVQFCMALGLLLGSRGIQRIIERLRYGNIPPIPDANRS